MTVDQLLTKWIGKKGAGERAEYQQFLTEFAQALGLPTPGDPGHAVEDYRFEAPVKSEAALGSKGTHRIDLYKRDHFILEAKQSQVKAGEKLPEDPPEAPPEPIYDLFGAPIGFGPKAKSTPRYDRLMANARVQAQRYALALPGDHRAPPFLIVADIGRSFEIYFDWSGTGRGYGPFPDERNYRIRIDQLGDPAIAGRLAAIWTDPASIDPRLKAAEVTRDVAERLSKVAAALEKDQRDAKGGDALLSLGIEETSLFLMRLLFCMFAEDVAKDQPSDEQLLPKGSFQSFLESAIGKSDHYWRAGLSDLWSKMNQASEADRYWSFGDAMVRHFNGNLFASAKVFLLPDDAKTELLAAAKRDWRRVEPAIFGTLLEQVLTVADRAKLGAHYTPRPYVERLVDAVMMEVLRPEWEAVLGEARASADAGETTAAIEQARAFHDRLAAIEVLDPACGTGNFLYVAMEQLLRLETEVRQFVVGLGGTLDPRVHPNQFLGLELNPRAAVIAELVLWIGWLRYRLANTPEAIGDPVLPTLTNINFGTHGGYDAVLVRTATGQPDTGNPRRPPWPEADFIVGNPPFIGGKDIRERLGSDTAEALWKANPQVPKSADFVMHWWDRAAHLLTAEGTRLRRFGFVTTNSITQVFSRRVIEKWLSAPLPSREGSGVGGAEAGSMPGSAPPASNDKSSERADARTHPQPLPSREGSQKLHLTLAIPDHPWTSATKDAAAVRIAMTVAEAGAGEGRLVTITGERGLDSDTPLLDEDDHNGTINADLSVGTDVTKVVALKANEGLCSPGVKLHGAGFIVTPAKARELGLGTIDRLDQHIRHYRNGRDLLQRPRGVMVIDLFGLTEDEVMDRFPAVYQHLLLTVKPERDKNRREYRRKNWWLFGENNPLLRSAIRDLNRFIATTETSKHRLFHFLDQEVLPDNMVSAFASGDAFHIGILSSEMHVAWALDQGGTLEDRPRWSKTLVFDPFPFPDPSDDQRAEIARLAERLDATRRTALDENPSLTMTGLYNLVAVIRDGTLPPDQEQLAVKARARIVAKLHDDLDAAVAAAYGWPADLSPAEIVARLVALNAARAAEEKAGTIRWLRPDYQKARFGR